MQMLLDYPKEEKIARMIISPTSTGGVRGKLARDASSCWAERHRNSLPLSWSPASPKLVNILFSWTRNSLPLSWSPASLLLQELSFVQSPWRDLENLTLRRGRCMCQGANVFIYKIFNKLTKTILPMLHIRFAFPDIWTLMKQNSVRMLFGTHGRIKGVWGVLRDSTLDISLTPRHFGKSNKINRAFAFEKCIHFEGFVNSLMLISKLSHGESCYQV